MISAFTVWQKSRLSSMELYPHLISSASLETHLWDCKQIFLQRHRTFHRNCPLYSPTLQKAKLVPLGLGFEKFSTPHRIQLESSTPDCFHYLICWQQFCLPSLIQDLLITSWIIFPHTNFRPSHFRELHPIRWNQQTRFPIRNPPGEVTLTMFYT